MRRLYADMSPGLGWNGRQPETLEAATATQITTRTVTSFLAAGLAALETIARPLAFLVGGATPGHAPATATITGIDAETGEAAEEVVALPTSAAGARIAGAVCSQTNWKPDSLQVVYSAGSGTGATVAIGFGLIPGVGDLRLIAIEFWLEGFGDRRNLGMLNPIPINEIVRDASSTVDSRLVGSFDVPFDLPPPTEAAKAARYLAIAAAAEMRPTVFSVNRETVLEAADAQLQLLRSAQAGFGERPPGPSGTEGGIVVSRGPRTMVDSPDGTVNSGDF